MSQSGYEAGEDTRLPHQHCGCRFAIWPRVREFIESLPAGAVVADVGCGNGKYFGVRRDIAVLGSDRSSGLAHVAAQRLKPESASGAYSILARSSGELGVFSDAAVSTDQGSESVPPVPEHATNGGVQSILLVEVSCDSTHSSSALE